VTGVSMAGRTPGAVMLLEMDDDDVEFDLVDGLGVV